jgi:hypothetical protein
MAYFSAVQDTLTSEVDNLCCPVRNFTTCEDGKAPVDWSAPVCPGKWREIECEIGSERYNRSMGASQQANDGDNNNQDGQDSETDAYNCTNAVPVAPATEPGRRGVHMRHLQPAYSHESWLQNIASLLRRQPSDSKSKSESESESESEMRISRKILRETTIPVSHKDTEKTMYAPERRVYDGQQQQHQQRGSDDSEYMITTYTGDMNSILEQCQYGTVEIYTNEQSRYQIVDADGQIISTTSPKDTKSVPTQCLVSSVKQFHDILTIWETAGPSDDVMLADAPAHLTSSPRFVKCNKALNSMLVTSTDMRETLDTRMCPANILTYGMLDYDPCCTTDLSREQCCAKRSIYTTQTTIVGTDADSMEVLCPQVMQNDESRAIMNAVIRNYASVDRALRDETNGCSALKTESVRNVSWDRQAAWESKCSVTLSRGLTRSGAASCQDDSDCYTSCNADLGRCKEPIAGDAMPWVDCALDQVDPSVAAMFLYTLNITTSGPRNSTVQEVMDKFGVDDCSGPGDMNPICLLQTPSEEECNKNPFNLFSDGRVWVNTSVSDEALCINMGANYRWVGLPTTTEQSPVGCVDLFPTESSQSANEYTYINDIDVLITGSLKGMNVSSLSTKWSDGQCKVSNFDASMDDYITSQQANKCDSECKCKKIAEGLTCMTKIPYMFSSLLRRANVVTSKWSESEGRMIFNYVAYTGTEDACKKETTCIVLPFGVSNPRQGCSSQVNSQCVHVYVE